MGHLNENMHKHMYWCFDNELNYRLWHIFLCLETGEEQTIDLSAHPHIAYANEVSWKCTLLAEGLSSLQVLQKMLKTSIFPLHIGGDNVVNRHEWFRITYDLIHYRLAALRDYAFQLVNTVLELEISPFQLKLDKLKKCISSKDKMLISILENISNTGGDLRRDRNKLAHEGIYKGVYVDPIESYKVFAMLEGNLKVQRPEALDEYLINYKRKFKEMGEQFHPEADILNKLLNDLGDHLLDEFMSRYNAKLYC